MELDSDTAFAAAQIIAMLLVATMIDPWAKNAVVPGSAKASQRRRLAAGFSYCAKAVTVTVLLFDMQIVLFGNSWEGTAGFTLIMANYFAVVVCALSVLLAVLTHFGAFTHSADETTTAESTD